MSHGVYPERFLGVFKTRPALWLLKGAEVSAAPTAAPGPPSFPPHSGPSVLVHSQCAVRNHQQAAPVPHLTTANSSLLC